MKSGKQPLPNVPDSTAALLGIVTIVLAAIYAYAGYRLLPRSQTTFAIMLVGAYIIGSGTMFATFRDRGWWKVPWRFWMLQFNFLTAFITMVAMTALHSFWPRN